MGLGRVNVSRAAISETSTPQLERAPPPLVLKAALRTEVYVKVDLASYIHSLSPVLRHM